MKEEVRKPKNEDESILRVFKALFKLGYIKGIDHRLTDHWPTDPLKSYYFPINPSTTDPSTKPLAIINLCQNRWPDSKHVLHFIILKYFAYSSKQLRNGILCIILVWLLFCSTYSFGKTRFLYFSFLCFRIFGFQFLVLLCFELNVFLKWLAWLI